MSRPESPASVQPALLWMEVGEPPASILALQEKSTRQLVRINSIVMPPVVGGVVGALAVLVTPGVTSWPLLSRIGLFFGVAIVAGGAELVFTRWSGRRTAKRLFYHPRRVAFVEGKIRIELSTGRVFDYPLKGVGVSNSSVADDWYLIALPGGKAGPIFYAPSNVALEIRTRKANVV